MGRIEGGEIATEDAVSLWPIPGAAAVIIVTDSPAHQQSAPKATRPGEISTGTEFALHRVCPAPAWHVALYATPGPQCPLSIFRVK